MIPFLAGCSRIGAVLLGRRRTLGPPFLDVRLDWIAQIYYYVQLLHLGRLCCAFKFNLAISMLQLDLIFIFKFNLMKLDEIGKCAKIYNDGLRSSTQGPLHGALN